jgi:peptide/nickel transport system substrate-binding protein
MQRFLWINLFLFIVWLLSACAPATEAMTEPIQPAELTATTLPMETVPKVGGTLVVGAPAEPNSLDFHHMSTSIEDQIGWLIGGSLLTVNPQGQIVPYLAESWTVSPDGLEYTFTLKKEVFFHNGMEMKAQDYVYTIERAKDPATNAATAQWIVADYKLVEVIDDYTFKIVMNNPYAAMVYSLTDAYLAPLSKEAVIKQGETYDRNPIGVGPYKLKEWIAGEKIILERNPDFNWGPNFAHQGAAYIEFIEYRFLPEAATIVAGMEAGEIGLSEIQPQDKDAIEATGMFQILEYLLDGSSPYVTMNVSRPPFDDLRVRQALNYGVDREALIKSVALGYGVPQYGPISSTVIGYWPGVEDIGYRYDTNLAKQLLAETGWVDSNSDGVLDKDGAKLSFKIQALTVSELWTKVAEVLQQQYKQLGIETEIDLVEPGLYWDKVNGGDYDMAVFSLKMLEFDFIVWNYHSSLGYSVPEVKDAALDEALEKTLTTVDPLERQEWIETAQKIIVEQAYSVQLFTPKNFFALSNEVNGAFLGEKGGMLFLWDAYMATTIP